MQVYRASGIDQLGTELLGKNSRRVMRGSRLFTPKAFGGCQPIELPYYKAAPLQALGRRRHVPYEDENDSAIIQCAG
ncbi:MAG: hypothetical protein WBZ19_12585 [Chthoniobacterales bacterium]